MLHQQLLQQQLAAQSNKSLFNELPHHIISTLDNMAFGIAQKENLDTFDVKQKLVANINRLAKDKFDYLVDQMELLIYKSANDEEINDKSVEKDFVTFLVRLYY